MKKLDLFVVLFLLFISANAQSPQAFKYQAIVRDATGEILPDQNVSFRIGIRDGYALGTLLYQETFTLTTNQFGLASIEIGNGAPVTGIFTDIDWGNNTKFLEVELDPDGGSTFTSMGTTQILSVPYALYAENAGYSNDGDWTADADTLYSAADSTVTIKDGKVGIGIINPDTKLHVAGNLKLEELSTGSLSDSLVTWDFADSTLKKIHASAINDTDWTISGNNMYAAVPGNVGIGTVSPVTLLHVNGRGAFGNTINSTKANRALNLVSTDAVMRIWRVTDATNFSPGVELIWGIQPNQGDEGNFWWDFHLDGLTGSFNIRDRSFGQGNETRMVIDTSGNVGIGTTNPDEKLHVAGALKIENMAAGSTSDSLVTWDPADSKLKVISYTGLSSDNDWTIDNDTLYSAADSTVTIKYGNVGIGITNPQRNLHISDVMRLEPRSSAPSDSSEGDLYINLTDHHIYCYLNGIWKQLD